MSETPHVRIAPDRATFDAAATGPHPYDGWVKRRQGRSIHLAALGENYVLNFDNVFCLATRHEDGRTWYSYGGKLNARLGCLQTHELATALRKMPA